MQQFSIRVSRALLIVLWLSLAFPAQAQPHPGDPLHIVADAGGVNGSRESGAGARSTAPQPLPAMPDDPVRSSAAGDLDSLFHRLNNQLGVILAHAELLEAKATDDANRARAAHVVGAALEALSVTRVITQRTTL